MTNSHHVRMPSTQAGPQGNAITASCFERPWNLKVSPSTNMSGGTVIIRIGKNIEFVHGKKIELLSYFDEYTEGKFASQIEERINQIKRQTINYKRRKKSKLLYRISNPKETLKKVLSKVK